MRAPYSAMSMTGRSDLSVIGALLSVGSGILLAGVEDGQHLYGVGDAIDEDVVGCDQGFAGAGHSARAVHIGMGGQAFGGVANGVAEPLCGGRVVRLYEVDDAFEIVQRTFVPDQWEHQAFLRRSMILCIRAMTSSCGMRGLLDASLASTFARNQAS